MGQLQLLSHISAINTWLIFNIFGREYTFLIVCVHIYYIVKERSLFMEIEEIL